MIGEDMTAAARDLLANMLVKTPSNQAAPGGRSSLTDDVDFCLAFIDQHGWLLITREKYDNACDQ